MALTRVEKLIIRVLREEEGPLFAPEIVRRAAGYFSEREYQSCTVADVKSCIWEMVDKQTLRWDIKRRIRVATLDHRPSQF